MTQLGDYHVKEPSGGAQSWMTTDGKPPWPIIGVGVAVVFTISVAAFWFLDRGSDEVSQPQAVIEEPPPTPAPSPPPTAPDPEPFNLPALDGSDGTVVGGAVGRAGWGCWGPRLQSASRWGR